MPIPAVTPAKITQPHPRGVYLRTRLFRILEEAKDTSCIWICGPPGAGKTTLAASFCDYTDITTLWYQVDEGDADVASFFYYLNQAAKKITRRRKDLPLFTPESTAGLSTFTRRYFEKLYSWLKPPFVLVLDNYQLVESDANFHDVIVSALENLPANGQVIVLSREEPPATFARLRANQNIRIVDWQDLCLDSMEVGQIAKLHRNDQLSQQELEDLEKRSDGWVAGLILILQGGVQLMARDHRPRGQALHAIFDYFAHEIFRQQPKDVQTILMQAALLPKINGKLAQDLTGQNSAGRILSELHQRNFFIQRHGLSKSSYQFHPLFREFLLAQLHNEYSPKELQRLQIRAAQLLELSAQPEVAIDLYIEVSEFANAIRLICELAPRFLDQGRARTVSNWITRIPKSRLDESPWLSYWLGRCEVFIDGSVARKTFASAYHHFKASNDISGMYLSWSDAVQANAMPLDAGNDLDEWIVEGEQLFASHPDFPSVDIEARFVASMCSALSFSRPDHPMLPTHMKRARALLLVRPDLPGKLALSQGLLHYNIWFGTTTQLSLLLQEFSTLGTESDTAVMWRTFGYVVEGAVSFMTGNQQDSLQATKTGLALCDSFGIDLLRSYLLTNGVWAALSCGDQSLARKYIEMIGLQISVPENRALYYWLQGWLDWSSGQTAAALEKVRSAVAELETSGHVLGAAAVGCALPILQLDLGQIRQGRINLNKVKRMADSMHCPWLKFNCCFIDASYRLHQGQEVACLDALRHGFGVGRELERYTTLWWDPVRMSRLCAKALKHDIEVDYVQELIRRNRLVPELSAGALENWPWSIRIYVLGEFRLMIDGQPDDSGSMRQKKVIELLKALVVLGGRDIDATRLTDTLWPDSDGDDANNALKTAVHRLRKLLGNPDAIEVSAGHVSLNLEYCWTDIGSFERLVQETRNDAEKPDLLEQAINLYKGPLLGSEEEVSWGIVPGERVRSEFLNAVTLLGQYWQSKQQWTDAVRLYERALEVDNLIESFYLQLMNCHQELGHHAEAIVTYERCNKTLAAELGVEPSSELQSFGQKLTNL